MSCFASLFTLCILQTEYVFHTLNSEKQLPLVAHLDGDIHFIDLESGRSRWSFKSGPALTSSYRRSVTDGDDNNCSSGLGGKRQSREARLEGDSYMYCGEDWDLYVHSRNKGSMKMPLSPEEFVSALPLISDTGEVILGSKKTTAFLVNERDGKLIHRYGSENDSDGNDDKAIVKVQDDYQENLVLPKERIGAQIQPSTLESVEPIFITRTDYSFTSYAPNKTILWNVTVAAIQATSLCQNSPNGYAGVQDIATGELNREMQFKLLLFAKIHPMDMLGYKILPQVNLIGKVRMAIKILSSAKQHFQSPDHITLRL
ncbi:hypothetical protein EJ110_NYTH19593 [Nymphaea thermarum]|nr:hypothetical protein EJ110_NYTH19593 [Nymphaea thermarum]